MTVEPLLSPQEIADLVGISYHGVLRDIRSGKLRAVAKGKGYKVPVEWYREWLEADVVAPHRPQRAAVASSLSRRPVLVGSVASLDAIEREETRCAST